MFNSQIQGMRVENRIENAQGGPKCAEAEAVMPFTEQYQSSSLMSVVSDLQQQQH